MEIDQPEAFALSGREALDPILDLFDRFAHNTNKLATRAPASLLYKAWLGVEFIHETPACSKEMTHAL
jgi:hypothetical protein